MRFPALTTVLVLLSALAVSCATTAYETPTQGEPEARNTRGGDTSARALAPAGSTVRARAASKRTVPAAPAGKVRWESPFTDLTVLVDRRETLEVVKPKARPVRDVRGWESPFMAGNRKPVPVKPAAAPARKAKSDWESPFMED